MLTTPRRINAQFEKDQPPFYYSSESQSEMSIGDLLQLQLYKTSGPIRVIDLHLVSVLEV